MMDHSLPPDMYRLIYGLIKHDFETTVSWFRTSKAFQAMVTPEDREWHSRVHVTGRNGNYWDGPTSRPAMFQGREGILWRTRDSDSLPDRDWPKEVWDLVLNHTDEDWAEMHTREYSIYQELESAHTQDYHPTERREWFVRYKYQYTFYERAEPTASHLDYRNHYDRKSGPFIIDEIAWHNYYEICGPALAAHSEVSLSLFLSDDCIRLPCTRHSIRTTRR